MKKHMIKIGVFCLVAAICVSFVGCKDKITQQTSSEAQTESVANEEDFESELLPVKSTFPADYTYIKSSDEEFNIKGNMAFSVKKGEAIQYDPNTYEGIVRQGTFKLKNDIGVGSKCADMMKLFGITLGYYSSLDANGKQVDPFVGADSEFKVVAILSYDEDTEKITYSSGGKVVEHLEGIQQAGGDYLKGTSLGKDLLVITIDAKKNATVESFVVAHYIF